MAKLTSQNDLQKALEATLTSYTDAVAERVKDAVRATAADTAKTLKRTSPGTRYKRGWYTVTREETADHVVVGVQNRQYKLTHLLENPHKLRNGKQTDPSHGFGGTVHIAPAEKSAESELAQRIEDAIEEAGK